MSDLFVCLCLFFLGASLGSFFTLVGSRSVLRESIIKPRSHCDSCYKQLNGYELIPVVSFLMVRGRCLNCGVNLPINYVVSEFISGVLFILGVFLSPNSYYLFGSISLLYVFVVLIARKLEKHRRFS